MLRKVGSLIWNIRHQSWTCKQKMHSRALPKTNTGELRRTDKRSLWVLVQNAKGDWVLCACRCCTDGRRTDACWYARAVGERLRSWADRAGGSDTDLVLWVIILTVTWAECISHPISVASRSKPALWISRITDESFAQYARFYKPSPLIGGTLSSTYRTYFRKG